MAKSKKHGFTLKGVSEHEDKRKVKKSGKKSGKKGSKKSSKK